MRITSFSRFHVHPMVASYIRLSSITNRWNFPKAAAPYWRIYWNNRPGAYIRQGARSIALHPGILAIIPPDAVFSTRCDIPSAIQHFYLHFHVHPLPSDTLAGITVLKLEAPERAMVKKIIRLLNDDPARAGANRAQFSLAVSCLIEWSLASAAKAWRTAPAIDARILKIMRYIADRLGEPLPHTELARQADMSVTAFRTLFREQAGQTPHAYIRAKRIEKAAQLLHTRNYSIKQIADLTGFYNTHHFSRVFRRLRGITPAEFRRLDENPFLSNR
ncbi:MAG: helix-turn-helix domain-containing protein [Kiritimatiellia bacterium]